MTMPVEISLGGSSAAGIAAELPKMSFVLPEQYADAPPTPVDGSSVEIAKRASRLVAVLPFPGLVTDEEVGRQREAVVSALAAAVASGASPCEYAPVDPMQVSILQYNSPITVPWRRRNEVAVVIQERGAAMEERDVATEERDVELDERSTVVSWYDAGKRL